MWLDKMHKITKDVIQVIIGLCASGQLLSLKIAKNDITNASGLKFDRRVTNIDDIFKDDVQFASMVIGYKIYYSSTINFVSSTSIYATYEMPRKDKRYDQCELLHSELIKNLKNIKENKKNSF